MTALEYIRKRWDTDYYSDMEIWDLAEYLLRIATEQEAELTKLRTEREEWKELAYQWESETGWYRKELDKAATLMKVLVDVVDAHDIDSLSCDRDGKEYCDCLSRAVGHIQGFLARQKGEEDD